MTYENRSLVRKLACFSHVMVINVHLSTLCATVLGDHSDIYISLEHHPSDHRVSHSEDQGGEEQVDRGRSNCGSGSRLLHHPHLLMFTR